MATRSRNLLIQRILSMKLKEFHQSRVMIIIRIEYFRRRSQTSVKKTQTSILNINKIQEKFWIARTPKSPWGIRIRITMTMIATMERTRSGLECDPRKVREMTRLRWTNLLIRKKWMQPDSGRHQLPIINKHNYQARKCKESQEQM